MHRACPPFVRFVPLMFRLPSDKRGDEARVECILLYLTVASATAMPPIFNFIINPVKQVDDGNRSKAGNGAGNVGMLSR